MWQKRTIFGVHTSYIYLSFWRLYEYLYLVSKYSSLLIIILYYVYLSTVASHSFFIGLLLLLWVRYFVVLFIFTQLSVGETTAPKQEYQQQHHQMVGLFHPHIVSLLWVFTLYCCSVFSLIIFFWYYSDTSVTIIYRSSNNIRTQQQQQH